MSETAGGHGPFFVPDAGPPPCPPPRLPKPGRTVPTIDPPDPKFLRWFLPPKTTTDCRAKKIANQTVRGGNEVKHYLFARDLWRDMKAEIEQTNGAADFIYIAGLDLEVSTDLAQDAAAPAPLQDLLFQAAARKVQIRALLNPFGSSAQASRFISSLAVGSAILDNKRAAAHHQKILVVRSGSRRLVAFCGGVDIHPFRLWWHDVHCRIRGPAAQDLHRTFIERWQDNPDVQKLPADKQAAIASGPVAEKPGDKHVQVVRTYGVPQGGGYCFAPGGERTIYELIARSIGQSQRFIYLEDQYLVAATPMRAGPAVSKLLAAKLRDIDLLVILIARTEGLNAAGEFGTPPQGWAKRRAFINDLLMADPHKVIVCTYRAEPRRKIDFVNPVFVHSKTWIFDDAFAIVGSANCDRRGYTINSEANVGIADGNKSGDRAIFAHDLRIKLWLKHLNPLSGKALFQEKDVADPIAASTYWRCPHPSSPIVRYDPDGDKWLRRPNLDAADRPGANPDNAWNAFDPDGS